MGIRMTLVHTTYSGFDPMSIASNIPGRHRSKRNSLLDKAKKEKPTRTGCSPVESKANIFIRCVDDESAQALQAEAFLLKYRNSNMQQDI